MPEFLARRHFPELHELESLIAGFGKSARVRKIADVHHRDKVYPLHCVALGSTAPEAPVVGFFAGVHGLEKIGSDVVLSYMRTLLEFLQWDDHFRSRLEHLRLLFMPLINPVGIVNHTRSNGNGVDLMRNSPQEAEEDSGPIYRGHRLTPYLPWYRGPLGAEMEVESRALIEVVQTELARSKVVLTVDVHSGFGARDRLWFPFAHSRKPFPYLAEAYALKNLFDRTYPHHVYIYEPMSRQYTIHGDLWDHLFADNLKKRDHGFFLPFCLEMGSWSWLRKNPLQIFNKHGIYHPTLPHRRSRILRRHVFLFDFLQRAAMSPGAWLNMSPEKSEEYRKKAMELWYAE